MFYSNKPNSTILQWFRYKHNFLFTDNTGFLILITILNCLDIHTNVLYIFCLWLQSFSKQNS